MTRLEPMSPTGTCFSWYSPQAARHASSLLSTIPRRIESLGRAAHSCCVCFALNSGSYETFLCLRCFCYRRWVLTCVLGYICFGFGPCRCLPSNELKKISKTFLRSKVWQPQHAGAIVRHAFHQHMDVRRSLVPRSFKGYRTAPHSTSAQAQNAHNES